MEIIESKIPVPQVIVEEEVKVPEVPLPLLPKEITEEDYNLEMAAKITEMAFLVSQVDIMSESVPQC
jgi:hypothetical protein